MKKIIIVIGFLWGIYGHALALEKLPIVIFDLRKQYLEKEVIEGYAKKECYVIITSNLMRHRGSGLHEVDVRVPLIDAVEKVLRDGQHFRGINYQITLIRKDAMLIFPLEKNPEKRKNMEKREVSPGDIVVLNDFS